jgi:predicted RNA-binding Zn ribbon-like protein
MSNPHHLQEGDVPAALLLVRDFVNTREPQVGTDELTTPAALRDWCATRALVSPRARMDRADLDQALAVREGLRAVLMGHAGHDVDDRAVDGLNRVLAQVPVGVAFDAGAFRLIPSAPGALAQTLAALADAVRQASEDQTWWRLKVCDRATCRWAFYDASRNQTRRWCSMAGCGNHVKMKRAYARRAQSG